MSVMLPNRLVCRMCDAQHVGLLPRPRQESGGASGSSVMFYKRTLNYSAHPHLPNGLLVPVDAASPRCVAVGHRSALIYLKQAWSTEREEGRARASDEYFSGRDTFQEVEILKKFSSVNQ